MADLVQVRRWADALIALHLDASWSFGFDHAKTRAGLCNFTKKRITVSRHLAARFEDDEIHQVLLHEVAHALAGAGVGHGPEWKRIARNLGYVGKRTHDGPVATEFAPWVGMCPAGHVHYRYRAPTRPVSCGKCSRRFDPANAIRWENRRARWSYGDRASDHATPGPTPPVPAQRRAMRRPSGGDADRACEVGLRIQ